MSESDGTTRSGSRAAAWPGRRPRLVWVAAVAVLPALVAGISMAVSGTGIERALGAEAEQALHAAGLPGTVEENGRDLTVTGVPVGRGEDARRIVLAVPGVRAAAVVTVQADRAPVPLADVEPLWITVGAKDITLLGAAPSEEVRLQLVHAVQAVAGRRTVIGGLTAMPGALVPWQPAVIGRLVAAVDAVSGERTISWDASGIDIRGTVPTESARADIEQGARSAVPSGLVRTELTVTRDATAPFTDAAELRTQVDQLLTDSPVVFPPDSAELPDEAKNTLSRLAQLLLMAKDRSVVITGHVAPGPGSSAASQELGARRARAVRDELVALGVPPAQVVASAAADGRPDDVGQGGTAVNRRVAITIH